MPGKDWEAMWSAGLNPGDAFDARRVEPAFEALIATGTLPVGRSFVPGCGRGYAVAALASPERSVIGLEISETAKEAADAYLSTVGGAAVDHARIVVDDFFTHAPADGPYDLVYDCTFLCAIPPARRTEWAAQMSRLVRPGGEIVSLVFPIGDFEGGPPFALSTSVVEDLLEPVGFERVSLTEVPPDQWARGRQEFLYRWRRKRE